ncbi:MAG: hypothetical protein N2320_04705 [Candidatus Bipolaricaulota bacterium]|nr:hypothetical protein [Candidatus Bipolaricaulota bacterium]
MALVGAICLAASSAQAVSVAMASQATVVLPSLCRISIPQTSLAGQELTLPVALGGAGEARGDWVELAGRVRITVHSNVSWKVRVRVPDSAWVGAVALRVGRGEPRVLAGEWRVLAVGEPGIHEVVFDCWVDRARLDRGVVPLVFGIEGGR